MEPTFQLDTTALPEGQSTTTEQRLAFAVLLQAFRDAGALPAIGEPATAEERADARAFLTHASESLLVWSRLAGREPEVIIAMALRLQRRGWLANQTALAVHFEGLLNG